MASLCTMDIMKDKPDSYVLLHLAHTMFPIWDTALSARGFTSMPPVVITGARPKFRMHKTNPLKSHETWYPFRRKGSDSSPDSAVVQERCGVNTWRTLYQSAHKADLAVSKEEREVVNTATGYGGDGTEDGVEEGNFRYICKFS
jgi:hypothetical protein